jgi:hypothetical protein
MMVSGRNFYNFLLNSRNFNRFLNAKNKMIDYNMKRYITV